MEHCHARTSSSALMPEASFRSMAQTSFQKCRNLWPASHLLKLSMDQPAQCQLFHIFERTTFIITYPTLAPPMCSVRRCSVLISEQHSLILHLHVFLVPLHASLWPSADTDCLTSTRSSSWLVSVMSCLSQVRRSYASRYFLQFYTILHNIMVRHIYSEKYKDGSRYITSCHCAGKGINQLRTWCDRTITIFRVVTVILITSPLCVLEQRTETFSTLLLNLLMDLYFKNYSAF